MRTKPIQFRLANGWTLSINHDMNRNLGYTISAFPTTEYGQLLDAKDRTWFTFTDVAGGPTTEIHSTDLAVFMLAAAEVTRASSPAASGVKRPRFVDNVLAGRVPGVTADPENLAFAPENAPVDYNSVPGTKVRFTGYSGTEHDQSEARALGLTVDGIYTVDWVVVGGWRSTMALKEFPDRSFNTVMFSTTLVPPAAKASK